MRYSKFEQEATTCFKYFKKQRAQKPSHLFILAYIQVNFRQKKGNLNTLSFFHSQFTINISINNHGHSPELNKIARTAQRRKKIIKEIKTEETKWPDGKKKFLPVGSGSTECSLDLGIL